MSNYVYTDNNNAQQVSKFIQGPAGPIGPKGLLGDPGEVGLIGIPGEKGPDNILRADVAFNDNANSFFTVRPYVGWTLVGHIIASDLQNLSSVKVIIGGNTNNDIAQCGLLLTDNIHSYSSQIDIAKEIFQFSGRGRDEDLKIINMTLNTNTALWPPGDTLLSLWAYIEPTIFHERHPSSPNTTSVLDQIEADYGVDRANIEKQRFDRQYKTDEKTIQRTLERTYGINFPRTERYIAQLRKEWQTEDRNLQDLLRIEQEKIDEENKINAGNPNYVPKDAKISTEYEKLLMERKPLPRTLELQQEIERKENSRLEKQKEKRTSENLDDISRSTSRYQAKTTEESEVVIFEDCADWAGQWCGARMSELELYVSYLELQ